VKERGRRRQSRLWKGRKIRSINKKERRGDIICQAREVSSKNRTRDKGRGHNAGNSDKAHNGSLGNSNINASRDLAIRNCPKLKMCKRIHGCTMLTSKKSFMLS
jgi:hypothetical protein